MADQKVNKAADAVRLACLPTNILIATTFNVPVEMPVLSTNTGRFGVSDALSHLSSANCDPTKTRKESKPPLSASLVRSPGRETIRKANGPPESLGKNEKSIWEHYNEMAAVEDYIRGDEWRDLADTVLVFVCLSTISDPLC